MKTGPQRAPFAVNQGALRLSVATRATIMHIRQQPLISPAVGTARQITSFHYGPGGGRKAYVQSSVHADELPAMLVAWALRRRLAAFEAAGRIRGEIVVVPVANPIGLA